MKLAFRSEVFSSKYRNKPHLVSRHDTITWIVQTMLFEMVFLLDSYSRRSLKFFGWYGLFATFTKTWSGGLSCVVSSLPVIVVYGFHFRVVLWFGLFLRLRTPGSVSLAHGFTHNKSVPLLVFDTSSKIPTANWNSYPLVEETRPSKWHQRRVVFMYIFSTNMGRTSVLG